MRIKKENKKIEELKNNKKVKRILRIIKILLYIFTIILSFKYSVIIANNIIYGLQQIVNWGVDNMTKLVFGILVAIVTIINFKKK